ncbi:MAG: hypothetical protein ACF8PG_15140 [Maioricimonas sp. JB045]
MYRTLLSLTFASFLLLHGCAGDTGTETAPTDDAAPATDTDLGEADLGEPAGPEAMESGSAADETPPEQSEPEVPTPADSADSSESSSADGPIPPEPGN